ncbi:hypothetical protein pdam_00004133, partial [Pocillopora damicornis]
SSDETIIDKTTGELRPKRRRDLNCRGKMNSKLLYLLCLVALLRPLGGFPLSVTAANPYFPDDGSASEESGDDESVVSILLLLGVFKELTTCYFSQYSGEESGVDSGEEIDDESESGDDSGEESGEDSGEEVEDDDGEESGDDSGEESEDESGDEDGDESGDEDGDESGEDGGDDGDDDDDDEDDDDDDDEDDDDDDDDDDNNVQSFNDNGLQHVVEEIGKGNSTYGKESNGLDQLVTSNGFAINGGLAHILIALTCLLFNFPY